jgi:hypothetical protein
MEKELSVFREFASVAPLDIDIASIESRQPPEPDILCTSKQIGQLAFELVELIDESAARRHAVLGKTYVMLRELPERLPPALRNRLRDEFSDPLIFLHFKENVPMRDRERVAIEGISKHCDNLGIANIDDPNDLVHESFESVHFYPSASGGLRIEPSSGGYVSDPSLERIKSKFSKKYDTEHPVHLLAYVEIDLRLPDLAWREGVDAYIRDHIAESPFKRVWIFAVPKKHIDYVYPES